VLTKYTRDGAMLRGYATVMWEYVVCLSVCNVEVPWSPTDT